MRRSTQRLIVRITATVGITVAILIVLTAIFSPLAIRYVKGNRNARALDDSKMLGAAILAFHVDTGLWPVNDDLDQTSGELSWLVGLSAPRIQAVNLPPGVITRESEEEVQLAQAGAIADHLIRNRRSGLDPIYRRSTTAPEPPGWNGPYLRSVPLDPWGRPYVCNVRYLDGAQISGVEIAEIYGNAVSCLSAGPDGRFDVWLADAPGVKGRDDDDIGWEIQREQTP